MPKKVNNKKNSLNTSKNKIASVENQYSESSNNQINFANIIQPWSHPILTGFVVILAFFLVVPFCLLGGKLTMYAWNHDFEDCMKLIFNEDSKRETPPFLSEL